MAKNVQLCWIAEAEARSVRHAALIEHAALEPYVTTRPIEASRGWRDRLRALAARVRRIAARGMFAVLDRCMQEAGAASPALDADRALVTIMISDIVGSTALVARLGDYPWRELLDRHDDATRQQIRRFGGREIRHCGDGFFAIFDNASRAIRCASAIAEALAPLGIWVRSGIHTGEVHLKGNDISGIAAHVAARIAAVAQPCEAMVSGTVRDLVAGSQLALADRGTHRLRGLPEEIRLFAMPLAGNGGDHIAIAAARARLSGRPA